MGVMGLPDVFLEMYLGGSDLIIARQRVHHLKQPTGSKSTKIDGERGFLKIGRTYLALSRGPSLDDLEANHAVDNREQVRKQLDTQLHKSIAEATGNPTLESSDPDTLKKEIAHHVMAYYSLADMLRHQGRGAQTGSSGRQEAQGLTADSGMSASIDALADEIGRAAGRARGCLKKAFGTRPFLLLKGTAYHMKTKSSSRTNTIRGMAEVKLGRGRYTVEKQMKKGLAQMLEDYEDLVSQRISDDFQANQAVQQYIRERTESRRPMPDYSLNSHYDPESNIGFVKENGAFYLYTKTPPYCLYERRKGNYFSFPPARVAVAIEQEKRGKSSFVSMPLVLDRYKHPALQDPDEPYQSICFGQFRGLKRIEDMPPVQKAYEFLRQGAKMLMKNYRSSPYAYHNLYKDDTIEMFRDLIVPESEVDMSEVTNLDAIRVMENNPRYQV